MAQIPNTRNIMMTLLFLVAWPNYGRLKTRTSSAGTERQAKEARDERPDTSTPAVKRRRVAWYTFSSQPDGVRAALYHEMSNLSSQKIQKVAKKTG
jgi:hypothetical protein